MSAKPITGTVTSGTTDTVNIPLKARHIQIDAQGGTLAVGWKIEGQSNFTATPAVSLTDETTILDLVGVVELELSATVADVDYSIHTYLEQ